MSNEVVAFVHAKGASERLPGKNLRILGDRPLFCHAVTNALGSRMVTKVVVDSDCDDILNIGKRYGAVPLKRPSELATNVATGDDLAYWQASNYPDSEIIVQVVPTSPFLRPASIDRAVRLVYEKDVDSVVGVFREVFYRWIDSKPSYFCSNGRIPNSFEMQPIVYETTGLYANRTEFVLEAERRTNPNNCFPCYLSRIEAIDINYAEDFEFAEIVWRGMQYQHGE